MVNDFGGSPTTIMVVGPTIILGVVHYDHGGGYHDYEAGREDLLFLEVSG